MTWNYAYTPFLWPSVGTVLLLLVLAVYSWRRHQVPGARQFAIAALLNVLWVIGNILENAAVDPGTKFFWLKAQGFFQYPVCIVTTCFILEYTWPGRWLTRRNLGLLFFPYLVLIVIILIDDRFHIMWNGYTFNGVSINPIRSWGFWIAVSYGYILLIVDLAVLAWLVIRSPQNRWPVMFILLGQIVSRGAFVLERAYIIQTDLPLEMIWIGFESSMYAIALFGFRILDPIPLARLTALEQIQAGILVLDQQDRVTSLNAFAEKMLFASHDAARQAKGKRACDLLPAYPERPREDQAVKEIEFIMEGQAARMPAASLPAASSQADRCCTLTISDLKDWRGLEVGRLLLLRDVTEQKRAQAQILEQQRALAVLQERERLARELHDSLGQTLAAAHLQAGAARMLLDQGEMSGVDECLEQVARITIAAETDVREYLLGAKVFFPANLSFFSALRQYAQRFSQQYGLPVDLCIPAAIETQELRQEVSVQALRIIQEALSNVRKHARANHVQVAFSMDDGRVRIAITDDGQGFEPALAGQFEGFGLQSMRERAEMLGGSFAVHSQPGRGTQVIVEAPLWGDTEVRAHGEENHGRRGRDESAGNTGERIENEDTPG